MSQPALTSVLRRPVAALAAVVATTIVVGTGALWLGPATSDGFDTSFGDALFTAVSASTSTGLTVVDTAQHWSAFGKAVIAVLFEVSAIAVMTTGTAIVLVLFPRLGVRRRISELGPAGTVANLDVRRLVTVVAAIAFAVQLLAAFALTLRFWMVGEFGFSFALRHGVFEAMSAYTNAGFTLNSNSMMQFATDWWVSAVVMITALIGALGIPVALDSLDGRHNGSRWTNHTKMTLAGMGTVFAATTAGFLLLEWDNDETLGSLGTLNKVLVASYQSVMARSTGFFSIEMASIDDATSLLADAAMLIGGAIGSPTGGFTATTLIVLILVIRSQLRGNTTDIDGQTLPQELVRVAATVFAVTIATVVIATIALLATSTDITLTRALFEVCSAYGATGWSQDLTADLDGGSRVVVIVTMLIGRFAPIGIVASALHTATPIVEAREGAK